RAPIRILTKCVLGVEEERAAGARDVREWHWCVERQLVEGSTHFRRQSDRVDDVKCRIEWGRASDRAGERRWERPEGYYDSARGTECRERFLLDEVSRVL